MMHPSSEASLVLDGKQVHSHFSHRKLLAKPFPCSICKGFTYKGFTFRRYDERPIGLCRTALQNCQTLQRCIYMRTWKTHRSTGHHAWRHAYNDAICEFDVSARREKIEIARAAILDEIKNALRSGSAHPSGQELRASLKVLNAMSAPHHRVKTNSTGA
jgi:hypothetical protein